MFLLQVLTPFWWWIMIVPFAFGVAGARSGGGAFLTGFLSAGLLWLGGSFYMLLTGSRIIAGRMAKMLGLGMSWPLIVIAGLIAAVAAAFSGYAGCAVRSLFKKAPGKGPESEDKERRSV